MAPKIIQLSSEGNYHFEWEEYNEDGKMEAKCQQDIFATTLADATATFTAMHGGLEADTAGCVIQITCIIFNGA